ncbi:hypothetical protein FACS1894125_0250 [Actinomycetota bacterium]|nr:hypothetical protein FACS1894125_0250 [Actinomycetota bacterium]
MDARDCENVWTGLNVDLADVLGYEAATPAEGLVLPYFKLTASRAGDFRIVNKWKSPVTYTLDSLSSSFSFD